MRVGIFTESYPPLVNGVSTSVQTLIAQLEQAGHQTFVFTSKFPRFRDERPGIYRYPSVNAIVEPDYVLPIPISPRIAAVIPTLGLDIVHSQSPFLLGLLARRVARRYGLPHISTNHTLYTEYAHYIPFLPDGVTRRAVTIWMRNFYNTCNHVLAPSHLTGRRLREYGVHVPVSVVPTGIPAPPYLLSRPADTKQELGLPPDSHLLLYVGRLAPEKNLETLLRAFLHIRQKTNNTFLVIAGSGKSAGHLQREAQRLGLTERVVFTGFLGRTRLDPLYAASDLFLFPSTTETQGLAVGEALAAGVPCVVVNGGGAPEAISDGENGFLVENDAAALADMTLRLLGDEPLRARLAARARQSATELTPENVARRIITIYEGLLDANAAAPAAQPVSEAPSAEGKDWEEVSPPPVL